ncbi:MAG: glycosyltransferase family 4 protein [Acidimicrobiales bacterium]
MTHLLVTNDFPPKIGGIQSYLGELWSRLSPERAVVLTTRSPGWQAFDEEQRYRIVRVRDPVLLPSGNLSRRVERLAAEVDAGLILFDPVLPVGWLGPRFTRPFGVILHGAETTVPGRLPGSRALLRRIIGDAALVVAAGEYPAAQARWIAGEGSGVTPLVIPPGVDGSRFSPLGEGARSEARARWGVPEGAPLVVSLSRLVPRKGMDVLIAAAGALRHEHPGLVVLIGGEGRERRRLERLVIRHRAPVRLLGRVPEEDLPLLYGAADVFAMLCRDRWGGLEQEGFGIVFVEAAACGVAQLAGASGGATDAVIHEETGLVVKSPRDVVEVAAGLDRMLRDRRATARMGAAARRRSLSEFAYEVLASRLDAQLARWG